MPQVPARHPVTLALKTALNSAAQPLGVPGVERFEIGRAPEVIPKNGNQELIHGYGIIYALTSPIFWGSLDRPYDSLTASYQVTVVGRTDEQAQRIQDAVRSFLLSRTAGGSFTNALAVAGHTIIDRVPRESGMVEQISGGTWQVPDVYDLEVQAHA